MFIPDASRRQPPSPQDFGCISFVWGLSREISEPVVKSSVGKFGHFVGDVEAKSGYGRSC